MKTKLAGLALNVLAVMVLGSCGVAPHIDHKIPNQAIDEGRFVELGGVRQWITVRGSPRHRVLLVIHGGPGDVYSPYALEFAPFERDYLVVQWDQRGTGRTFVENGPSERTTYSQLTSDGIELASSLQDMYGTPIVLLGHSLGTTIATNMALRAPERFVALVATGQTAQWADAVNWQFSYLKNAAVQAGDAALQAQLVNIGTPDPDDASEYFGFARYIRNHFHPDDTAWLNGIRDLLEARLSADDFQQFGEGMQHAARALWIDRREAEPMPESANFELPYILIQGRHDLSTPTELAEKFYERATAPFKRKVILEDAGHFALITDTDAFLAAMNDALARAGI